MLWEATRLVVQLGGVAPPARWPYNPSACLSTAAVSGVLGKDLCVPLPLGHRWPWGQETNARGMKIHGISQQL